MLCLLAITHAFYHKIGFLWPWQVCIFYRWWALCHSTTGSIITSTSIFDVTVQNNTWCDITCVHVSDESSSSTASGNAGGGESDSDSSYCPTSDSCESETVVKEGPVLGSIVIHPLVLQFIEPTERPSYSKQPESVGPVCSAVRCNPAVIPNRVGFVRLSQIGVFVNKIRGCKTQGCDGNLVPVAVKSTRLGGGLSVFFGCDGCKESFTKYEHGPARNNDISVCVQVAFIIASCTHAVYCKTLQNALDVNTVHPNEFYETMYPVVKAMVDDLCEVAKREMKETNDGDLGSWKRAVTTADGTWQTRGWHSKNATFTISC